jgi:hypothetical protein
MSQQNICNYRHFTVTTDIWYVYNTEMTIYGNMSVKLVFVTQATGHRSGLPTVKK